MKNQETTTNPFYSIRTEDIQTIEGKKRVARQAVINADTDEIISVVSDKYEVVSNKAVVDTLEKYLKETDVKFKRVSEKLNRTGSRFTARYILPEYSIECGTHETSYGEVPDNIQLGIDLHNSYDGSSTWGFSIFGYRLVCLNGLRVPEEMHSFKTRHFVEESEMVDNLILSIQTAISIFQNDVKKSFDSIKKMDFEKAKAAELFKALELGKLYAKKLGKLYKDELKAKNLKTMWDFYQMVTWFSSHVVENRNVELAKKISSSAYDTLVQ